MPRPKKTEIKLDKPVEAIKIIEMLIALLPESAKQGKRWAAIQEAIKNL